MVKTSAIHELTKWNKIDECSMAGRNKYDGTKPVTRK